MKPKVLLYFLNVGKNALEVNGDWSRKSLTFCKLHFLHFSFTFYIRTYVIMHLIPEVFARHRTFQSSRHAFPRDCFIVKIRYPRLQGYWITFNLRRLHESRCSGNCLLRNPEACISVLSPSRHAHETISISDGHITTQHQIKETKTKMS